MKRLVIPLGSYLLLAAIYLCLSNAPPRVHALSLAVLALAVLVPACWSAGMRSSRRRRLSCLAFAVAAIFFWDAFASGVIANLEPLFILRGAPWLYALGVLVLAPLSLGIAWLAAPSGGVANARRSDED